MNKIKVAILGSTGSIGTQTLDVIRRDPDRFEVVGLACGSNLGSLAAQAAEFRVPTVCLGSLSTNLDGEAPPGARLLRGKAGLCEIAAGTGADVVVVATVGEPGFAPTVAALQQGISVALASKELLVMAGPVITELALRHGSTILPIDSEHSALWQCMQGENRDQIKRLILTASGGPFRATPAEDLDRVTPSDALKHPTWYMGAKITIDSATLMNKGMEVIEAHWLFGMPFDKVDVVVHPESVIHSMVEFVDGSVKAQLGPADMRVPIAYALTYPERSDSVAERLDFAQIGKLTFYPPDHEKFPLLRMGIRAGEIGGTAPAVLCGADEVAVSLFLSNQIGFPAIADVVAD